MVRSHETPRARRQQRLDTFFEVLSMLGVDVSRAVDARATSSEWKRCLDAMSEASERMGVAMPRVRILEGRTFAAATLRPSKRWIGMSLGLLHQLSHEQLVTVFGHELAHLRPSLDRRMRTIGQRVAVATGALASLAGVPLAVETLASALPTTAGIAAGFACAPAAMTAANVFSYRVLRGGRAEELQADRLSARATGARTGQLKSVYELQRSVYMRDLQTDIEAYFAPMVSDPVSETRHHRVSLLAVIRHPIEHAFSVYGRMLPMSHPTDAERILALEDVAREQNAPADEEVDWFLSRRNAIGNESEVNVLDEYSAHVRSLRPVPQPGTESFARTRRVHWDHAR